MGEAGASGTATAAQQPAGASAVGGPQAAATSGTQLWVKRYNGPANGFDSARVVAVSPGGGRVFVSGTSGTLAYRSTTGKQLWLSRYHGPDNRVATIYAMAVSPDGHRLFVTGESEGATSGGDYITVAYNTATGAQLWAKRYNGTGNSYDFGYAVAVSPNGSKVFVTGSSTGRTSKSDYATLAYNTATGTRLWVKRYHKGDDAANAVAVSPSGRKVYVTGYPVTLAYSANTGALLWGRRDAGASLAVSPGGGRVFVTGSRVGNTSDLDYVTTAYNSTTGARLWVKRYNGQANGFDRAVCVAVGRHGNTVFVTGSSAGKAAREDYATVAYSAATGVRLWVKRYNGSANGASRATDMAVGPGGGKVFVTGFSHGDYATVAYSAATGAQLWARHYNGPVSRDDIAFSVTVNRTGKVFVTGQSIGSIRDDYYSGSDYATVAYSG